MKKSVSQKMFYIMTGLLLSILVIYILLNTFVLKTYYIANKQGELIEAFKTVKKHYKEDTLFSNEVLQIELEKITENKNVNMIIIDSDGNIEYNSSKPMEYVVRRDSDYQSGYNYKFDEFEVIQNFLQMQDYELKKVLKETDEYVIQLYTSDKLGADFLTLTANLTGGTTISLRSSIQSIEESAKISNDFIAFVGLLSVGIGAIVSFVVAKQFTKPIAELSNISENMAKLDFTKKYKGITGDEIDILGNSMNKLSEKLETTITELKEANMDLERDIEEKSKIDEMRQQFLSDVSHELKTPIALIQGYAEGLVENVADDEESRKFYCEVILDETNKMDKLVKQLLTLSKIEYGNEKLNIQRLDIIHFISDIAKKNKVLFENNEISFELINEIEAEKVFVMADEFMLEQVLTNYLNNAIKHVNEEKIITVTIKEVESKVRIIVFNTGDNIPEEQQSRLWTRFYKIDKSRNREDGGSGIGLALVKAIMQKHNNIYGVENVDNGVEFYLELDKSEKNI